MGFLFLSVKNRIELCLWNLQHNVTEHLDEAAVAVQREPAAARQCGQPLGALIVQPQIQNGVHHAGHRDRSPGADGDQERVLLAAEVLAGNMLQIFELCGDVRTNVLCDRPVLLIVAAACLRCDRKAKRNRQPDPAHFCEISPLASE